MSIRKSQFRTASRLLEFEKAVWELSKGCCWRRKLNRKSASRLSFLNVVVLRTSPGWVENLALYLCEHNLSQPVADCLSIRLQCSPRTPCITRWGRISEQVSGLTNNRNSPGCESRDRERERESPESGLRKFWLQSTLCLICCLDFAFKVELPAYIVRYLCVLQWRQDWLRRRGRQRRWHETS